jgi:hypothetical protein
MFMLARMAMLNSGTGVLASTVTKTDAKVDTSNSASYSFASVNLGTPSPTRYIVVVVATGNAGGRTFNSVTVAGNATTKLKDQVSTTAGVAIFITNAPDTSNSTGTIVFTPSAVMQNCSIVVYAVTGLISNAADGTPQSTTTSGGTMSQPVSAGGVVIGGCATSAGSAGNFTWSGLTEDVDQLIEAGNGVAGAASIASASAQTLSISSTAITTSNFQACCVALR